MPRPKAPRVNGMIVRVPVNPFETPVEVEDFPPKPVSGGRPVTCKFQKSIEHCRANPGKAFLLAEGDGVDRQRGRLNKKYPDCEFVIRTVNGKQGLYARASAPDKTDVKAPLPPPVVTE